MPKPPETTDAKLLIDALEPRQLLAGFNASINFQPHGPAVSGWTSDTGQKFGVHGDLSFGWNIDNGQFMVDRHTSAKQRYDTLAFMGIGKSATRWEISVPNGLYRVKILAGDARYTNSKYAFDAEGRTILNKAPNKANHWRKGEGLVWVSDGKLTVTSAAGAKNNKIDSIEVQQVDPHVTGTDIVNPFSMSGIVQSIHPGDGDPLPLANQLRPKNMKLWYDVQWDAQPNVNTLNRIKAFKKAGYTVTVTFGTSQVPTYNQAKAFFQRIADYPDATAWIDYWELGNEPNHGSFWTGTPTQFIQNFMRPAYEVLKPLGEPTIGGGVTFDASYCAQLQSLGYSNYCDYAGFHPYGFSAAQVIQRAVEAKAAFAGKPMIVTEWNLVWDPNDLNGWANQLTLAANGLKDIAYLNFYYGLRANESQTGAAGVFTLQDQPNQPFYDAVKAML